MLLSRLPAAASTSGPLAFQEENYSCIHPVCPSHIRRIKAVAATFSIYFGMVKREVFDEEGAGPSLLPSHFAEQYTYSSGQSSPAIRRSPRKAAPVSRLDLGSLSQKVGRTPNARAKAEEDDEDLDDNDDEGDTPPHKSSRNGSASPKKRQRIRRGIDNPNASRYAHLNGLPDHFGMENDSKSGLKAIQTAPLTRSCGQSSHVLWHQPRSHVLNEGTPLCPSLESLLPFPSPIRNHLEANRPIRGLDLSIARTLLFGPHQPGRPPNRRE